LLSEIIDSNIGIYTIRFSFFENKEVTKISMFKYKIFHVFDNFIAKQVIAFLMISKDKMSKKSKTLKQFLFIFAIFICIF
jgi:hypothetical protein